MRERPKAKDDPAMIALAASLGIPVPLFAQQMSSDQQFVVRAPSPQHHGPASPFTIVRCR